MRMSRDPAGTVCAAGAPESWVTFSRWVICVLDALIFLHLSRLRNTMRQELEHGFWSSLSNVLFACAIVTFGISSRSWATEAEAYYAWHLFGRDIQSLLYNSILASIAVISCISLMPIFGPALLCLLIVSMSLFRFALFPWIVLPPIASFGFTATAFLFTVSLLLVLHFDQQRPTAGQTSLTIQIHAHLRKILSALAALGALWYMVISGPPVVSMSTAVHSLASFAKDQNDEWMQQASSSKSLPEAIKEYRRRYGIPAPPLFDKWYAFAVEHNSPIIDDFDQIDKDLNPFWGISPAEIRARTTYIMSHRDLEMGSMRIRNGKVDQSPHIAGSHRWMTDNWQKIIDPFAKWLPDMDLAVNLADECHVSVPFRTMSELLRKSDEARTRLDLEISLKDRFSKGGSSERWPKDYPQREPLPVRNRYFRYYDQLNIFGDFIPDSCPPGTPSKSQRWGDWSSSCLHCAREHSIFTHEGPIVSNAEFAKDMCHQPDMSYLNGFLSSPARVVGTRDLLPIFSQSRLGGFHDILWPSPWDFARKSEYKEKKDVPWDKKRNALYWRGASSDGFASHRRWPGFLRPRFNNEANQRTKALITRGQPIQDGVLAVNASFVGETHRCDPDECAQERLTFHEWAVDVHPAGAKPLEPNELAPSLPFEEHWQHRHLFDADGAGYSGRFLAFLESHSLVYRAAAFQTWFDGRVQAWKHYVPVDLRLGSGFWTMLDYLSGGATAATDAAAATQDKGGDEIAHEIAESGREWAQKALRPVDMQIYAFRLLLEWARIIDDDRDKLGFVLQ